MITKFLQKRIDKLVSNRFFAQLYRFINAEQVTWPEKSIQDAIDKGYLLNHNVYSLINILMSAMGGIPWLVYEVKDEKKLRQYHHIKEKGLHLDKVMTLKEQALEEVSGTGINKLIEKPNQYQGIADVMAYLYGWYCLTGNGYLYGMRRLGGDKGIIELHVMPANIVEIALGTTAQPVGGYTLNMEKQSKLEPDEVMHWRTWNPNFIAGDTEHLYGLSPLGPGGRLLGLDNEAVIAQGSSFKNVGARGVLHGMGDNGNFTKEQGEKIQEKWKAKFAGADRYNEIAFAQSQVGFTQIGLSPVDLNIIESFKTSLQFLCNLWNVPITLMNDTAASTESNVKEARKRLYTNKILPDADRLRDKLNGWIVPAYSDKRKYYIDYDLHSIVDLQDDLKFIVDTLKQMDWITANEQRAATNYGEIDDPAMDIPRFKLNQMLTFDYDDDALDKALKDKDPYGMAKD